jgi:rhodanese-related sulfurtransferase
LERVSVDQLADEMSGGALIVDVRPLEQRQRDGVLPGAVVIDRNVLEWRLDPASQDRLDAVTGYDRRIVLVCNEGYSSSLAAATLQELGLYRATDLIGGFQAWRAATHWDSVYAGNATNSVSWYQANPDTSLRLLRVAAPPPASVIDVGAGASMLADRLLSEGFTDIAVLDVSATALALMRDQLAGAVRTVVADLLSWTPDRTFDAWHDRATFHFLVRPADRDRYLAVASAAVRPGGALIVGTFAANGPEQCSGLPTARYDPAALARIFQTTFTLELAESEVHRTPWGDSQPFTWVVLRRRSP